MTEDIKQRVADAIKPGGINEISAKRTGELLQIIIELTAREEKLVAALKDISKKDDSLEADADYCNSYRDVTCGYIAKKILKELGIE